MPRNLFRKEVLEEKRGGWSGDVSLARPTPVWALTSLAATIAAAIVMLLFLGSYTRRERVPGQLVPSRGQVTIVSPTAGVVKRLNFQEGQSVKEGSILAVVVAPSNTSVSANTASSLQQVVDEKEKWLADAVYSEQRQLDNQRLGLRAQIVLARREFEHIQKEISTQEKQVVVARDMLDRISKAEAAKIISTMQVRQQESALISQESQLQSLQRQSLSAQRSISLLEQQLSVIPNQMGVQHAAYRRDLATLRQDRIETATRGELRIVSPTTGIISNQLVTPGQSVQTGQIISVVLPENSQLQAELFVPSRAIGFVEKGNSVLLRYTSFPSQKFGNYKGKVEYVSDSALSPIQLKNSGLADGATEPLYRVLITPEAQEILAYGKKMPLKSSMTLEAEIMGDKRTLADWLLEPIYSLRGKLSNKSPI